MPLISEPTYDRMPMANPSPIGSDHTPIPVRSQTTDPSYKASAIDTDRVDRTAILSHIEGSPWAVNWYEPILGRDQATIGHQQTAAAIHQQYHVIVDMELRVQNGINHSQDQTSAESTVTGSAIVYPFLVPNKGSIFTAPLFDGSLGIFEVTSVERLSVMRETCHTIDYILIGVGTDHARLADILNKVVKESYFVKDFIYHGQNPILVKSDFDDIVKIQRQYVSICQSYIHNTYSTEYATLLVPHQVEPTFDRFLTYAVHHHMDHRLTDRLKYVRMFNVEDDPVMFSRSLWDVLRWQDRAIFEDAFTMVGLSSARDFTKMPLFEGIRYSGIRQLIYPANAASRVDSQTRGADKVVDPITGLFNGIKSRHWESLREQLANKAGVDTSEITDDQLYAECGIKPIHKDGYYIFSKEFYDNAPGQSRLEALTNMFIDRKPISFADIRWLSERMKYWSPVEAYFYCPVLIILMKASIRSI